MTGFFSKLKKKATSFVKKTIATAKTPAGLLQLGTAVMTGGAAGAITAAAGREATQEVAGALVQKLTAKGVDHAAARRMADAIAASNPNITPEGIEEAARQAAEKYAAGGGTMLKKVGLPIAVGVGALGLLGIIYFLTRKKKESQHA